MTTQTQTETRATAAASHTPGPWVAKELHGNYSGFAILREMPCGLRRVDGEKDGRFNAWDGRLIAAAPELLAALKSIAGKADQCAINRTEDRGFWLACAEEARAAIARAEFRA